MKKQELIKKLDEKWECLKRENRLHDFYKEDEINLGSVNTPEYIETIAEWLMKKKRFDELKKSLRAIPLAKIGRETTYDHKHGLGVSSLITTRKEEVIAYAMYNSCAESNADSITGVGRILNYQIPLKSNAKDKPKGINDGIGKIDLVSYKEGFLYIIELKQPESKESLLRCILESYTYARSVKRDKFVKDFSEKSGDCKASIGICAMFFSGELGNKEKIRTGEEYDRLCKGKYPNLQGLIREIEKDLKELNNGVATNILFCNLEWNKFGMKSYFCTKESKSHEQSLSKQ